MSSSTHVDTAEPTCAIPRHHFAVNLFVYGRLKHSYCCKLHCTYRQQLLGQLTPGLDQLLYLSASKMSPKSLTVATAARPSSYTSRATSKAARRMWKSASAVHSRPTCSCQQKGTVVLVSAKPAAATNHTAGQLPLCSCCLWHQPTAAQAARAIHNMWC